MINFGIFPATSKSNNKKKSCKRRLFSTSLDDSDQLEAPNGGSHKPGAVVISVVENRARDVCIAKFDTEAVRCQLSLN